MLEFMNRQCKSEVAMFFRTIQPSADLRVVRLVVARASRDLDLSDVRMLCCVRGPLNHYPASSNARYDSVHKLKLGDLEVV